MKIMIAVGDPVARDLLEANLVDWGNDVVITCDGNEAREALHGKEPPRIAILDFMKPCMDGIEICNELREMTERPYIYTILLVNTSLEEDFLSKMDHGADDCIHMPLNSHELRLRIRAGKRFIELGRQGKG